MIGRNVMNNLTRTRLSDLVERPEYHFNLYQPVLRVMVLATYTSERLANYDLEVRSGLEPDLAEGTTELMWTLVPLRPRRWGANRIMFMPFSGLLDRPTYLGTAFRCLLCLVLAPALPGGGTRARRWWPRRISVFLFSHLC